MEDAQKPKKELLPKLASDPEAIDPERREKIEKIKKALADGTYRISNEDVARKVIEHMRDPKS
jgi:anti-sigma28 factor (negative regulator of flagellin synthesis)